jgi:hypothetical protein
MSLRDHRIQSAIDAFDDGHDGQVIDMISETAQPSMSVAVTELSQRGPGVKTGVGHAAVRAGAAILLIPDPLPVVDELVGLGLLAGGAYLVESER